MADLKIDTGNPMLDEKITEWLKWDKNERTRAEVEQLVRRGDVDQLEKTMVHRMVFGTAGLRGRMGAGYALMNDLVIIQTSQVRDS
ncbi:glucose 1,6-bisphosphate synthase-like [Penaeus monodon]|uniref:glucose 1,6-bisphosphate synthase-like n=1 Tax=Penaeus monodon TaxID=6687 RepID=UPI0018A79653|nr:glucose 1,6-bisphosphate synthase-like [Penaeus monodon]